MGERNNKNNIILDMITAIKILLRIWQLPQYLYGLYLLGKANLNYEVGWHLWKLYKADRTCYCGELNFSDAKAIHTKAEIDKADGYATLSRISGIWYPIMVIINGENWAQSLQIPQNAQKRPFWAIMEVFGISVLLWVFALVLGVFLARIKF